MRIQHNIMAMNAYRNYNNNTSALSKNLEKLSSGYKINRAGDDAAGLAISEKMRAQITGLNAAQKNVKDGISLVKTGEGAMQEIQDMLNRMDYLATQSANGTYDNEVDRLNLQKEVNALKTEINRIADSANFNGIKLLDGSLDRNMLPIDGTYKTGTAEMAKGIEFEIGQGGGGSKGEFSLDIQKAFGNGDTVDLVVTDAAGTTSTITATYGTNFSGSTIEEQAQSLANYLKGQSNVASDFSVNAEGGTVTLTNLVEGNDQATAAFGNLVDKATTKDATWAHTDGTAITPGTAVKMEKLFGADATGAGENLKLGQELTFKFETAGGKTLTATITVDENIANATTNEKVAEAVINKLNASSFDKNGSTAIAEESLKVGDVFDIQPITGTGGISFNAKVGGIGGATKVTLSGLSSGEKTVTIAANAATASKYVAALDAGGAGDYTTGDQLTIKGSLGDGKTFEFTVEAGKDFAIDAATPANTMTNLKKLLESDSFEVKLSDGSTVKGSDIFGDNKEIALTAAAGSMTFTSKETGTAGSKGVSAVTDVALTATATAINHNEVLGAQKTGATSTVTFQDDAVDYGSIVEIDGVSYEIVKSADERTNFNNIAVVVDDVTDGSKVASAFADAVNKAPGNGDPTAETGVTATAKGNKVEITTNAIGSEQVSPVIATNGDTVKTIEFKLDPTKIQNGSKVEINGQTYEFTDGKAKVEDGNIAVKTNLKNADAKSLADALVSAVKANAKNTANISQDAEGLVTVKGTVTMDGEVHDPSVSFHDGKGGLTLQIGDTADDFNQMNVSIGDMHTFALGIDGVNIGNQDDAKAAIDVIKNAINYVSGVRGDLGAIQNRLDHTANNLSVMAENIQDAESTIRDTDVAEEMMSYVKNNILVQSAQAMLAQANQVPQGVLQLLG
ncbi:flagellin [Oscillospiraceae bacterium 50-16]